MQIEAVVSPAMGGVIIGHEMGRALGKPAMFVERPQGVFELRRGFHLEPGTKVLMVEDVVTTGLSSREAIDAVRQRRRRCRRRGGARRPLVRQRRPRRSVLPADPHRRPDLRGRRSAARACGHPGDQAREPSGRVTRAKLRLGRQHRSCRDHPERARRRSSRPGARGDHRGRGRRRRDHRASARGPPPHYRPRHRPADGRDRPAAEPRNGGDRGDARDRAAP